MTREKVRRGKVGRGKFSLRIKSMTQTVDSSSRMSQSIKQTVNQDTYNDRQLTPNFELWVEILVCWHVYMRIPKSCLSVCPSFCPYTEKTNHPIFVNISPTVVIINASMERSSRVLQHVNPKIWISFQKRSKLNFDLCWRAEITLSSSISVLH